MLNRAWGDGNLTQEKAEIHDFKALQKDQSMKAKEASWEDEYVHRIGVFCDTLVNHAYFNFLMISIILFAAVLAGLQTQFDEPDNVFFNTANVVISTFFIVEIVVRIAAENFYLYDHFSQLWNCMDFIIVILSLLDGGGVYITIIR